MKPIRVPGLPWREVDGRAIIISPKMGEIHELDPVATFLWNKADGMRTLPQICTELVDTFDVSFDQAFQDVQAFFCDLNQHRIVDLQQESDVHPD